MNEALIPAIGIVLAAAVTWPFIRRVHKHEERSQQANLEALRYGLYEPASLHPIVDPSLCIGIGNCVAVCPEHDVLGLVDGQARPIKPANCVGHGLCERACPVDAITLVFGTEERGVHLPRIKANFETNVPGLYAIGELGGMGLIRNAFAQGKQCIDGIAREIRNTRAAADMPEVAIIGCGPAGLAASLHCLDRKIPFITLEKEDIGGTVRHYPRKKLVMTEPVKVPGYGRIGSQEMLKEQLIDVWSDVVERTGLEVLTGCTVNGVRRRDDGWFEIDTDAGLHRARRVILAIGRRGIPRKLGVPGEDSPSVQYSLREPEAYQGDRVLVVGGGDSAVEAALSLAEQPGNEVRISYRRETFARIKPRNQDRIQEAIERRRVDVLWKTQPREIQPESVVLAREEGEAVAVPNDHTFVFIGGELPTKFLEAAGVEIDAKFGEP